jgi:triacylglycerol lipase
VSFLSQLPEELYRPDAFFGFRPSDTFSLSNAKAMIWLSQLSNEVDGLLAERVLRVWGFEQRARLVGTPSKRSIAKYPLGVVAARRDVCLVAFPMTDPLSIGHWKIDLTCKLNEKGLHTGFDNAVAAVWSELATEIRRVPDGQPIYFTGHSLGGALATIAADRAGQELKANVAGVYTFGALRSGGEAFAAKYLFGDTTYRLVYGNDIFTAWPTLRSGYRHVGRALYCPHGQKFSEAAIMESKKDTRRLLQTLIAGLGQWAVNGFHTSPRLSSRSDLMGQVLCFFPYPIADHIPDRYITALSS